MLQYTVIECVQIFGVYGYVKEYPAERHKRDAKNLPESTNEIQRVVLSRPCYLKLSLNLL